MQRRCCAWYSKWLSQICRSSPSMVQPSMSLPYEGVCGAIRVAWWRDSGRLWQRRNQPLAAEDRAQGCPIAQTTKETRSDPAGRAVHVRCAAPRAYIADRYRARLERNARETGVIGHADVSMGTGKGNDLTRVQHDRHGTSEVDGLGRVWRKLAGAHGLGG